MSPGIIDTHAHYDDERFAGDADALFREFRENGVAAVITCSTDQGESYAACAELAERYDFCYLAAGLHPQNAEMPLDLELLSREVSHPKCVAVGEIGLDYHYGGEDRERQYAVAREQILLAGSLGLPVSFHDRDAHADTLRLLRETRPRGAVHCFSGSAEMAEEVVSLGMYIGVGGVVTFSNARKTVRAVEAVPLERIVLETDAPYLAPAPHRGERNRSDYILHIAAKVGEIKGVPAGEVLSRCGDNARELFRLP